MTYFLGMPQLCQGRHQSSPLPTLLGKGWEKIVPSRGFFRYINPGPFNIKEHCVVIIMCSTAASSAVAIQVISVQDLF